MRIGRLGAMAPLVLGLSLIAGTAASTALPPEVEETSYVAPDGSRVLQHELVVAATPAEVWQTFTTAEGLKSWAVPSAWVDFRLGGTWETSYDPDARQGDSDNIITRILAYQPLRMIAIQAVHAPPDFAYPELLPNLFSVFTFEPAADGGTRIRASGVGYRDGEGYDHIYAFFRVGNAWTLEQLRQRFVAGPVDWATKLKAMPRSSDTSGDDAPDTAAGRTPPPARKATDHGKGGHDGEPE